MTHATLPRTGHTLGWLPRLALAVIAALALVSGVLNLRPALGAWTGAATAGPAAVDALAGIAERPPTSLDAQILFLQDSLRAGDARGQEQAATMLGQAYLQQARESGAVERKSEPVMLDKPPEAAA